jgi:hypothetical protein
MAVTPIPVIIPDFPLVFGLSAAVASVQTKAGLKAWQTAAKTKGWYTGAIDGLWGPLTATAANKARQARFPGSPATGILDATIWPTPWK